MLKDYLIVHKNILPEYYEKVLEARRLLESGKARDVSQAVKEVGISRSTYYKYKEYILEPSEMAGGRKAVLSMLLTHEPGVLSALLNCISQSGASVLTITQSLPIHDKASVTLSLDTSSMPGTVSDLLDAVAQIEVHLLRVLVYESRAQLVGPDVIVALARLHDERHKLVAATYLAQQAHTCIGHLLTPFDHREAHVGYHTQRIARVAAIEQPRLLLA